MWIRTHRQTYPHAKPAAIWSLWADVNRWVTWHSDLDSCTMEGPFEAGNHFKLKPKGGPVVKIELLEVSPNVGFTDVTRFPGARMVDTHHMELTAEGLTITNTVQVTGFLSFLWVKLVAKNVADSAAAEMDSVVALAGRTHA